MKQRGVAVTGIGIVSALGPNASEFWRAICECRPGIRPIELVDRGKLRFQNGAEACGFDAADHLDDKTAKLADRFAAFGLVAAREATRDAAIEWTEDLRGRTAIVTGSCLGSLAAHEEAFIDFYMKGRTRVHPMIIPRGMASAAASHISMEFGITGPAFTLTTACSSANHAIGHGFWMVRNGQAEAAIVGGSEAPFNMAHLKAWEALRVVAPDTCRPFSKGREGMILGEGGAMMVLEPLDAALARGARVYAEIAGFGMSSDAHHITGPSADGPAKAMRATLRDGDLLPEQVDYINAHGTGTPANDMVETQAIRLVFGDHAERLAVSATKSMHGHTLGAAGAIEAAATALAIHNGVLPPTANFTEVDPECALDVVPNASRPAEINYALSNSFAFGGLNASIALRRPEA